MQYFLRRHAFPVMTMVLVAVGTAISSVGSPTRFFDGFQATAFPFTVMDVMPVLYALTCNFRCMLCGKEGRMVY